MTLEQLAALMNGNVLALIGWSVALYLFRLLWKTRAELEDCRVEKAKREAAAIAEDSSPKYK